MILSQLTNQYPPNGGFLPRATNPNICFFIEANDFKNIPEKYLNTCPYPYPESDIDEKVDDIDEPIPTVDRNTHKSTHRNFIGKPIHDGIWKDKYKITNG